MMSVVWLVFAAIGIVAAASDVSTYKIPNYCSIALCVLFLVVALWRFGQIHWLDHLGAGALFLVVGIGFYMVKQLGAGDAKLFAGYALWSGFHAIIMLLLCVAIASLIQLTVIIVLRWLYQKRTYSLPRVLRKREVIPLGVGIAVGGIVASYWFQPVLWAI